MYTNMILAGRYQLLEMIGLGGMAEVWLAKDNRLDRKVAIKLLKPDLSEDRMAFRRFQKEALNAASLNHPNIVAVFDSGEAEISSNTVPFIVMEYVQGKTLRDYIHEEVTADQAPIPIETKLRWIAEACNALQYSHENHIIHRDVKPANIMISAQGTVKVMDFGIARAISDNSHTMTQTAAVVGTAQYLSPEQARGETATEKSDIYSLGCVAFELLTDTPPFKGDSPVAVAYQHVRENAVPPSEINPELSPAIDAVVLKALNKNTANRYQTATEMRSDINKILNGEEPDAPKILRSNYTNALLDTDTKQRRFFNDKSPTQIFSLGSTGTNKNNVLEKVRSNLVNNKKIGMILASVLALFIVFIVGNKIIPGLLSKDNSLIVADVSGLSKDAANEKLVNQGFKVIVKIIPDNKIASGLAINTVPDAGSKVNRNTIVTLQVSSGPAKLKIPNLIGKSKDEVYDTLKRLGFTVDEKTDEQASAPKLKDKLVATDPKIGEIISGNNPIHLIFGKGITVNKVPEVVGKDVNSAEQTLESEGFTVTINQQDSAEGEGEILSSSPDADSKVPDDGKITLNVSKNNLFTVPNVADKTQSEEDAKHNLLSAGFTGNVIVKSRKVSLLEFPLVGKVLEQSIPAGRTANKNDTITIYIGEL